MSTYVLRAPIPENMSLVNNWRATSDVRLGLRTPYMLTHEMQQQFYESVICDRNAAHRYWSVYEDHGGSMKAFVGLTDISWENGHAEISLLVDPLASGKGVGREAVRLVLEEAFERMRLVTVFGECYEHNPAWAFWKRMLERFTECADESRALVPGRKMWGGELHGGWIFWFTAHDFYHTETLQRIGPQ